MRIRHFLLLVCCALSASVQGNSYNTVRLATTNWPPYVSDELPGKGLVYAIVAHAYQQQGYYTKTEFLPWTEAKKLHKYANDAFFPAYFDEKNEQLACSDPIQAGPVGLYKRKNSNLRYTVKNPHLDQAQALSDLKNHTIGIVDGYTNTVTFDQADYLKKVPAKNDYANLKQLQDHGVDLAFSDVLVAEYLIDEKAPSLDNITFLGPTLENKKLYVCFSKRNHDYPKKLAALNQGLKRLKQSGKMQALLDEYSF